MSNKIDVNVSDEINIECDITIGQGQKGDKGDKGDGVLLQKNDTHIQYKHETSDVWIDLLPLVDIKGDNGREVEFKKSQTHIQYRYVGDVNWINLVELSILKGDAFTYEDFTPEQLLAIKGDKGDTPSIAHLEEQVNTKIGEVNNLMLDVEEGEKNRDDNEDVRNIQESQRINSFKDIQTNSNKKIEELNVAKNDMTTTINNSLENFERRFDELESANPIGEVTKSRVAMDGSVKSSLSERLIYDFDKKANIDNVYSKNDTYNKKEVDNAIANVEVDLSGYATKEEVNLKPNKTYVDTQDTKILEDAKTYVDSVIDKANNFTLVTVTELPQVGEPNKVYLVRNSETKGDLYTEYIWVNNDWEIWGSASVDLSTYATKEELKTKSDVTHNHDNVYASKSNEHTHANKSVIDSITTSKVESWDNKSDFDGNYDSLIGKPTIPTVDVNKAYVDSELAKKSNVHNHPYKSDTYVPTWDETIGKPSVFPPSQHNHDENYYPKDEVNSFVQTIDVEYIDSLFTSTGDESNPIDYYTKSQSDAKYTTKEMLNIESLKINENTKKIETLNGDVDNLKQSVSNGKTLVASAITDKGVSTSETDSFKIMEQNIRLIKQLPSIPDGFGGVIVDKDENIKNIIKFDFKIDYIDGKFGVTKNSTSSYFKEYTQYTIIDNSIYYSGDSAVLVKVDFDPSIATVGVPYTPVDVYRYKWITSYNDCIYAITMSTDYTYTVLKMDKNLTNVETLFSTKNVIMNLHVFNNYLYYFDTTDNKIKKTTFNNTVVNEIEFKNSIIYTSHVDKFGNIIYHISSGFYKLSPNLQLIWNKPYPTVDSLGLFARRIVTDSKGNIAVGLTSSSSQSGVVYFYKPNGEFIKYVKYSGSSSEVSDVICDKYDIFHMITSYSRYYIMGKIEDEKYVQLGVVQLPSGCDNIIYVDDKFNFILTKTGSHNVYSVNISNMTKIAVYEKLI